MAASPPSSRPIVFIDVDGTLIPFRPRPYDHDPVTESVGHPLLDRLDPRDGPRLLALACPLVWATTWMQDANEVIAPRLNLPDLPLVEWPDDDRPPRPGLHWKTEGLIEWAAGGPFVWLDDEITDADRHWVAALHPARALLHRVDPYLGLTTADFAQVRQWLDAPG